MGKGRGRERLTRTTRLKSQKKGWESAMSQLCARHTEGERERLEDALLLNTASAAAVDVTAGQKGGLPGGFLARPPGP
jgi:hypothetical protein